jgi:acyl-CoA thioester hydrolase
MATASAGVRFHEVLHDVYFDDLDVYGILHNARYVLLVERTIGSFWRAVGFGKSLELAKSPDRWHLVRANHIEYLGPVEGVTQVRVRVWVEALGTTSLTFGFCVLPLDEDVDRASGTRVLVRVDPNTRRPAPWSPEFREQLQPYVRPARAP